MTKEQYENRLRDLNRTIDEAMQRTDIESDVVELIIDTVGRKQRELHEEYIKTQE